MGLLTDRWAQRCDVAGSEEEARGHEPNMWVTSGTWERQGKGISSEPSQKNNHVGSRSSPGETYCRLLIHRTIRE